MTTRSPGRFIAAVAFPDFTYSCITYLVPLPTLLFVAFIIAVLFWSLPDNAFSLTHVLSLPSGCGGAVSAGVQPEDAAACVRRPASGRSSVCPPPDPAAATAAAAAAAADAGRRGTGESLPITHSHTDFCLFSQF